VTAKEEEEEEEEEEEDDLDLVRKLRCGAEVQVLREVLVIVRADVPYLFLSSLPREKATSAAAGRATLSSLLLA
jgi:hypothetical protein